MPDDDDDQHIVLNFQPRRKPRKETGGRQSAQHQAAPEDLVASGAVVVALVFAVAIVSGWFPFGLYSISVVACLAALAAGAKLVKARRSKTSVTNLPR